ncbi:MAG: hypothetical protein AMXMBFR7_52890 [Planctomycetota bacterium]
MLTLAAFILGSALGGYAAVKGFRAWIHGETECFAFTLPGAVALVSAGFGSLLLLLYASKHELGGGQGALIVPFLVAAVALPWGLYFAGLTVKGGERFFSDRHSIGSVRSYDKGDAAMSKHDYTGAVSYYRLDAQRWPDEAEVWLRLARALESAGRIDEAVSELEAARRRFIDGQFSEADERENPSLSNPAHLRRERYERTLALTFALGDLYHDACHDPERAMALYRETLERLYGYPGIAPVRDRLHALESGAASAPPAVATQERLSLD